MPPTHLPSFPTYLIPTFSFRRESKSSTRTRQTSTSSILSNISVPSLSYSPNSSRGSTPASSPDFAYAVPHVVTTSAKSLFQAVFGQKPDTQIEHEGDHRLSRTAPNTLKCITCSTDIAFASQIVSKGFTGRHGRAYLVASSPTSGIDPSLNPRTELVNARIGRSVNRELLTGAHVVADVSCMICATVLGWKYVDAKEPAQRYKIGKYILEMKRVVQGVSWEDIASGDGKVAYVEEGMPAEDGSDDVVVFDEDDEDECEDLFAGIWDADVVAKRRARRVRPKRWSQS